MSTTVRSNSCDKLAARLIYHQHAWMWSAAWTQRVSSARLETRKGRTKLEDWKSVRWWNQSQSWAMRLMHVDLNWSYLAIRTQMIRGRFGRLIEWIPLFPSSRMPLCSPEFAGLYFPWNWVRNRKCAETADNQTDCLRKRRLSPEAIGIQASQLTLNKAPQ